MEVLQGLLGRAQALSLVAKAKYDEMGESLQSQLERLGRVESDLDGLDESLDTLDKGIGKLERSVPTLSDAVTGVEEEKGRLEGRSRALLSAIGERKRALEAMGTVFDQLNSRLTEVPDGSEEESLVGDGLDDLFTQLGANDTALRALSANVERLAGALDGRVTVLEDQYGVLSADVSALHRNLVAVVSKGRELWKTNELCLKQQEENFML